MAHHGIAIISHQQDHIRGLRSRVIYLRKRPLFGNGDRITLKPLARDKALLQISDGVFANSQE